MTDSSPPPWRLPPGVDRALWSYTQSERLAVEEAAYLDGHPLLETDARLVVERFQVPAPLADLGCGTGRIALRFARLGFPVAAVDLSAPMLRVLRIASRKAGLPILPLRLDLCRLGALRDHSFTYAVLLFSTLGMIRGRIARRRALAEAARIVRPGGCLALHAHNLWQNCHDPQGRRWLASQLGRSLISRGVVGDRWMTYRGIPELVVHQYRWRELRLDLRASGWRIAEVIPLDAARGAPIRHPRLWPTFRAGGWLVFAER
jgi:SAM-dependent methyltransferase